MAPAFSDYLKQFYGLDYLYNVLPYDIVGDTIGVVCGDRQELRSLRELFNQNSNEPTWLRLIPDHVPDRLAAADAIRRVIFDLMAVSRTRAGEPITLLPLGPALVGATADKPVDNAYRAVGSFVDRTLTDDLRTGLRHHALAWSAHPLARLTSVVVRHAQQQFGSSLRASSTSIAGPPFPHDLFPWLSTFREDLAALLDAWDSYTFGPEQELDHLRSLLCFHLARHVFLCAARRLPHRDEQFDSQPLFLCDAARMVGSPMARPAYHCLAFWLARIREAGTQVAWVRSLGLQSERGPAWAARFAEIEHEQNLSRRVDQVTEWLEGPAFAAEGRRPTKRVLSDFRDEAKRHFGKLYTDTGPEQESALDRRRLLALAQSLAAVYSGRSRLLAKVRDFIAAAGDGAGWVGPKGTHQRKRFLLREDLLEVLTLVHHQRIERGDVNQPDPNTVQGMVDEWAARYSLVVDPSRPSVLDLLERETTDPRLRAHIPPSGVAAENMHELEDRLVELRLARRYSDASVAIDSTTFADLRRPSSGHHGTDRT